MSTGPAHQLVIFGTGGSGREIAAWAAAARWQDRGFELACLIDEHAAAGHLNGNPVLTPPAAAARFPGARFIVAVGDPRLRERLAAVALEAGFEPSPPLVHPSVQIDAEQVHLGTGTVICPGSIVTVNVEIGPHVQVNVHCSVMHDAKIGAFATLSPGVRINGNVHVGARAFIGSGAVTVNGADGAPLTIGEGSVVGAGAVVTKDVGAGVTVTGVPARVHTSPPGATGERSAEG